MAKLEKELREARDQAVSGAKALEHARTNAKMITKREQELQKKELALEYRLLTSNDKQEEMLNNLIHAKMDATEARGDVDALRRENRPLVEGISAAKQQVAELKVRSMADERTNATACLRC